MFCAAGCDLFVDGPEPPVTADRCDQDRYDCQSRSDVPLVNGCELNGELAVEIGHGFEAFAPLAEGEPPPFISGGGGFQGGGSSHTAWALRIDGAALDRYDVIGAQLGVYSLEDCSVLPDGSRMCGDVPWIGSRSVLLGDGNALPVVGDTVEDFGLTVPMDGSASFGDFVLQVIVEDPCGQLGVAHHDYSL